ncbi:MAG: hypothetical protein K6G85_08395 [Eubacterium sp.]|nr:hypothetical protein [Eubacterium sp.]
MSIVSFQFLLFATIITGIYFVLPKKWQWCAILGGNIVFYAYAGINYTVLVFLMSFVSYIVALNLEKIKKFSELTMPTVDRERRTEARKVMTSIKQFVCGVAIIGVAGVWVVLKYSNFFIENFNAVISHINAGWHVSKVSWVLPLGMSFYTFHIIGYVVDVYRGKYPAEKNFAKYFTFVTYFPHVIQGPFSRFDSLGKSILEKHSFSYDRLCEGCARILWGVFKKMIIADKLGVSVNMIFDGYQNYPGAYAIFAIFAYCIELYADFSGYMDIVCGLSHIWGINLAENFRRPYMAKTIDEFWRRWHITLGAWFKDYVFYPVSMGKVGQKLGRKARKRWGAKMGKLVPGYFALIFVWTATGLWHGANWTYLVWGYLNLFAIMSTMQLADTYAKIEEKLHINPEGLPWKTFCVIRTFILVCFFRFFSIQSSLHEALSTLKHTFLHLQLYKVKSFENLFVGMVPKDVHAVLFGAFLLILVDLLQEVEVWDKIKEKCPFLIRNMVYAALIFLLVLLTGGSTDLAGGFMYANF